MNESRKLVGGLLIGLLIGFFIGLFTGEHSEFTLETWNIGYYHDFKTGFPPNYFGWGDLESVSEGIQINPGSSYCGAIFCPFTHKPEWGMETMVKVTSIDSVATGIATVSILTRMPDYNPRVAVKCESTFGIYPNSTKARCRHMINYTDELGEGGLVFALPFKIQLDTWYKLRFVFYQSKVECYINHTKYFEKTSLHESPVDYTQPHLAVFNGTAVFEYIKILTVCRTLF